jgi:hypothetical protein
MNLGSGGGLELQASCVVSLCRVDAGKPLPLRVSRRNWLECAARSGTASVRSLLLGDVRADLDQARQRRRVGAG